MIDLHNHILPAIDDGARDIEESLEMARIAIEQGFSGIVATPHFGSGLFSSEINEVRQTVKKLNQELEDRNINLMIFPGMEARLTADVLESLSKGTILSINEGCYILLELPVMQVPAGFENFLRMLLNSGKKIVLAHPEKNVEIQRRPEIIYDLVTLFGDGDFLVQITADSITGDAGLPALSTAKCLLEHNLAHILATDAHSPVDRPPVISTALELVASIVGKDVASKMTSEWPQAVVRGESVNCWIKPKRPEKAQKPKRRFRFFFK
ncbi:MAG: tyrosine-protein phosphatase [Desulfomonilaceae bacterium]